MTSPYNNEVRSDIRGRQAHLTALSLLELCRRFSPGCWWKGSESKDLSLREEHLPVSLQYLRSGIKLQPADPASGGPPLLLCIPQSGHTAFSEIGRHTTNLLGNRDAEAAVGWEMILSSCPSPWDLEQSI